MTAFKLMSRISSNLRKQKMHLQEVLIRTTLAGLARILNFPKDLLPLQTTANYSAYSEQNPRNCKTSLKL